ANDILEYAPAAARKIRVIPLAARLPACQAPPLERGPYMLFVGTIEPRKNLSRTIDAFLTLIRESPSCQHNLLIAGHIGWKHQEVQQRIREATKLTRVRYLGPVSDQKPANLY